MMMILSLLSMEKSYVIRVRIEEMESLKEEEKKKSGKCYGNYGRS